VDANYDETISIFRSDRDCDLGADRSVADGGNSAFERIARADFHGRVASVFNKV
jgi:hypothetical protein